MVCKMTNSVKLYFKKNEILYQLLMKNYFMANCNSMSYGNYIYIPV